MSTAPVPLANGLVWDGVFIPVVEVKSMYTDGRELAAGFHAHLPTENGTYVEVTYDREWAEHYEESGVSQWLYVVVGPDARMTGARVRDGRVLYHATCPDHRCDPCDCNSWDQWWVPCVDSPGEVLANLAWLGSLPVEVRG